MPFGPQPRFDGASALLVWPATRPTGPSLLMGAALGQIFLSIVRPLWAGSLMLVTALGFPVGRAGGLGSRPRIFLEFLQSGLGKAGGT